MKRVLTGLCVAVGLMAPTVSLAQGCPRDFADMRAILAQGTLLRFETLYESIPMTFARPAATTRFLGVTPTEYHITDFGETVSVKITLPGTTWTPYQDAFKAAYPPIEAGMPGGLCRPSEGCIFTFPTQNRRLGQVQLSMAYSTSPKLSCSYVQSSRQLSGLYR